MNCAPQNTGIVSTSPRYPLEVVEQDLERALRLEPSGAGMWSAVADPNYESANGMFGGWTTAVALRAVTSSAGGKAEPSVINVNFVAKI